MSRFSVFVAVLLSLFCFLSALSAMQNPASSDAVATPTPSQPQSHQQVAENDRIGPGDLLDLTVMDLPELTAQFRVSDRGDVALPLLGQVALGGMTVIEAQDLIASLLLQKDILRKPVVSVLVAEYADQVVSVLGEVGKPSTFPLIGNRKLYDALSAAGGLLPTASTKVTLLRRNEPEREISIATNVTAGALEPGNIDLKPGDTIIVRRAGVVYVVGEVGKPGGFVIQNDHISVLQALALAQGAKSDAKLNHALIVRRDGTSMHEREVKLKEILQAKAPDVLLGPDDVLFIPQSAGKASAQGVTEGILRLTTAAMIYVAR